MTQQKAIRIIADDFAAGSGETAEKVCAGLLTLSGAIEWIVDEVEDDEYVDHSKKWKEAAIYLLRTELKLKLRD
jgi:hypothetical protein